MDLKHKSYPFMVTAKSKTSNAGNNYTSIGLAHSKKNKDGEYESVWFNFIDERDLLVLANACTMAFDQIVEAKSAEHSGGQPVTQPSTATKVDVAETEEVDDSIPF